MRDGFTTNQSRANDSIAKHMDSMCRVIVFYVLLFALITETEFLRPSTIITIRVRLLALVTTITVKLIVLWPIVMVRLGKSRGNKDNS